MKNWKAPLVFLCIFLTGAVSGGLLGMRVACAKVRKHQDPLAQPSPRRPVERDPPAHNRVHHVRGWDLILRDR